MFHTRGQGSLLGDPSSGRPTMVGAIVERGDAADKARRILVGGRGAHVRCRRAIVFESGFAADLRCSTGTRPAKVSEVLRRCRSGERTGNPLVLRGAAWWLLLVGLSFWLQDYLGASEPPAFECFALPWRAKGSSDWAWLLLIGIVVIAAELWRLRKVGVIGGAAVLLWLVSVGFWRLADAREYMAAGFLLINLQLALVLVRASTWRACAKWV